MKTNTLIFLSILIVVCGIIAIVAMPEGKVIEYRPSTSSGGRYSSGGFPLSKFRVDMVEALKARYHHNFGVYGINWGTGAHSILEQVDEAKYYRNCKVAINLSHFDYSR